VQKRERGRRGKKHSRKGEYVSDYLENVEPAASVGALRGGREEVKTEKSRRIRVFRGKSFYQWVEGGQDLSQYVGGEGAGRGGGRVVVVVQNQGGGSSGSQSTPLNGANKQDGKNKKEAVR